MVGLPRGESSVLALASALDLDLIARLPRANYSFLRFDRPFRTEYSSICCLPFDGIGARHLGVLALAGSYVGPRQVGNSVFPFKFRSAGWLMTHRSP